MVEMSSGQFKCSEHVQKIGSIEKGLVRNRLPLGTYIFFYRALGMERRVDRRADSELDEDPLPDVVRVAADLPPVVGLVVLWKRKA